MLSSIRVASPDDLPFISREDHHINAAMQARKVAAGEILIAHHADEPVGYLRYGYFWDSVPFMNLLKVVAPWRKQGIGRQLVTYWEAEMQRAGYEMVMTSTLANEDGQHFYRRQGYQDIGGFVLPAEPLELILVKYLKG
jgi:GNAT superfamily N-acetyltransferase